jgi:hypothetical protein
MVFGKWEGCWHQPLESAMAQSRRLFSKVVAGARSRQYRLASMLWPHEPRGLASLGAAA